MVKASAAEQAIFRQAHPLAHALLEAVPQGSHVLEIGPGSGRNFAVLLSAVDVVAVESDAKRARDLCQRFPQAAQRIIRSGYSRLPFAGGHFTSVLSTHALLHGKPQALTRSLAEIRRVCKPRAQIFATFGSQNDRRFGQGRHVAPNCFAAIEGDEAGVAHAFFTRETLRGLLRDFDIESLDEVAVDDIAGTWAHARRPLTAAVHWFAVLRNPSTAPPTVPRR
jgi:SAM-dependent methyltransferase